MNPVRAGIVSQIKAYRWVWSDNVDEISLFTGFDPVEGREGGADRGREGVRECGICADVDSRDDITAQGCA